jgi:hypothetical protein
MADILNVVNEANLMLSYFAENPIAYADYKKWKALQNHSTRVDSDIRKDIKTHVEGSSNPEGNENCNHKYESGLQEGLSAIYYNDDTMGGSGSSWEKACDRCGKVWK